MMNGHDNSYPGAQPIHDGGQPIYSGNHPNYAGTQTSYGANHNGYNGSPYNEKHNQLDEDTFGPKGSIVSAFDAFREYSCSLKETSVYTKHLLILLLNNS